MRMDKIQVTDEMVKRYQDAWHNTPAGAPGDRTRAGLQAALDGYVEGVNADLQAELDPDTL